MSIPIIIYTAAFTCVTATAATGRYEFVLAENLGDELKIRLRDDDGQERILDVEFTSDPIRVLQGRYLGIVDSNNDLVDISGFTRTQSTDPTSFWSAFVFGGDCGGRFPIGFGSDMARQYDSVYLGPRNSRHVLVTNPENFEHLCLDNIVHFVPIIDEGNVFSGSISVDYGRVRVTIMFSLALSGYEYTYLPNEIYEPIRDAVSEIGCSESAIAQLPPVRFNVHGTVIEMLPEDYVEEIDGSCELKLRNSDWPTLGTNILKNLGLIIDYRNNRLGICDPI